MGSVWVTLFPRPICGVCVGHLISEAHLWGLCGSPYFRGPFSLTSKRKSLESQGSIIMYKNKNNSIRRNGRHLCGIII